MVVLFVSGVGQVMVLYIDDAVWNRALREIAITHDYAIKNGKAVPGELRTRLKSLHDLSPEQRESEYVAATTGMAALLAPTTLASIIDAEATRFENGRRRLIRTGGIAVIILILVTILGIFVRAELIGQRACSTGLPCASLFTVIVLGYGAALGLIGAFAYELFHASGISKSNDYGIFDDYRSNARLILGVTFGWIFSITISAIPLARIFNVEDSGDTGGGPQFEDYIIILLPFLLGYSSALITGLLDRMVDALRTIFGMERPTGTGQDDVVVVRPPAGPADRHMGGR